MSSASLPTEAFVRQTTYEPLPAPPQVRRTLLTTLAGDLASAAITLVAGAMLIWLTPKLISWAVVNGIWSGGGEACRDAGGACWAFLSEKSRQILFGIYPPGEHWRPAAVVGLALGLSLWSLPPRNWTRITLLLWLIGVGAMLILMRGGNLGLSPVSTEAWGGLPVTLLLTIGSLGLGFPLAVALALGRQSELRGISTLCIGIIETVRGLPLLSLLFIASILLPIMLPEGLSIDKLARALVALTVFSAAYLAEVLRGGLQALTAGQGEAARALGLSWAQTTRLIVLPQAIAKVIPPLTNTVIVMVKNTSLVLVVGLFDLLSSGRAAATDPAWPSPYKETYLFVGLIYFVICFGIARYSLWLERRLAAGQKR
ncbi:MAG TPA: amino acid ABC transporter permease [Microvirga sp.]|jgi:general L-amino acid transport system permease protein|nr:amino acid ABC transporter permease [Microvirga sp.]